MVAIELFAEEQKVMTPTAAAATKGAVSQPPDTKLIE